MTDDQFGFINPHNYFQDKRDLLMEVASFYINSGLIDGRETIFTEDTLRKYYKGTLSEDIYWGIRQYCFWYWREDHQEVCIIKKIFKAPVEFKKVNPFMARCQACGAKLQFDFMYLQEESLVL